MLVRCLHRKRAEGNKDLRNAIFAIFIASISTTTPLRTMADILRVCVQDSVQPIVEPFMHAPAHTPSQPPRQVSLHIQAQLSLHEEYGIILSQCMLTP